jgi:hypothetical protein
MGLVATSGRIAATRLIAHAPGPILRASNWPYVSTTPETYPDDTEILDVLLA